MKLMTFSGLLTSSAIDELCSALTRSLEDSKYSAVRMGALDVYDALLTSVTKSMLGVSYCLARLGYF